MKKLILVGILFATGSMQCMSSLSSLMSSFSGALQKGAQSLLTQGKDMIAQQSSTLLDQAKKQMGTLVDQAKAAAIEQATALKDKAITQATEMAKSAADSLKQKGTAFAMDAKNTLFEQAKAVLSKNPLGDKILAMLSPADKAKLETLTSTEQEQVIQNALNIADTIAQEINTNTNQTEIATKQAVVTVGQQAEKEIQASIDAKKSTLKGSLYEKFGKGTPTATTP
jgi:alpha-L-fucosidase